MYTMLNLEDFLKMLKSLQECLKELEKNTNPKTKEESDDCIKPKQ